MTKPDPAQLPLFPVANLFSAGELCARRFGAQFVEHCADAPDIPLLPRELDERVGAGEMDHGLSNAGKPNS